MVDALPSEELRLTNEGAIEGYFQRRPSSFPETVLKRWADANDDLVFKFAPWWKKLIKKPTDRVSINENVITFHHHPTLGDILQVAQLLRETEKKEPGLKFQNSTLERLGLMFVDSAIYLSHQDKAEEHKEQIETLFNLGANLEVRAKRANATPLTLEFEKITFLETNPFKHPLKQQSEEERKQRQETYENSLLFFLLGKHAITKDEEGKVLPFVSHYDKRYHQWLQDKELDDTVSNQQQFEEKILLDKEELLDLIFSQLAQDFLQQDNLVDQLAQQRILQRLDEAIQDRGKDLLEKEMPLSPLVNDLGKDLVEELKAIYGPDFASQLQQDELKLFLVADKVISRLKDKPTYEKLVALWDLIQAYEFRRTYIPKKVVSEKAIECNLRAYLLSVLLDRHLKDEVIVFQDCPTEHSSLLVVDKQSLTKTPFNPVAYFVDPTHKRWWYYTEDRMRISEWSQEQAVYQIKDQPFIQQIVQAWLRNPLMVNLQLKLNDQSYFSFFSAKDVHTKGYHNIINVKEGTRACLWNNLLDPHIGMKERRAYCLKALELNPNCSGAWYNLASTHTDVENKRACYLKALELDPNYDVACFNLTYTLRDIDNPQIVLNPKILKLLDNWLEKFIRGEIKPDWRTEGRINTARQVLEKIREVNSQL